MLGASLSEVWGEDFTIKPKKSKKKKFKVKPLSPDEMESELLIKGEDKPRVMGDQERVEMLRNDINPNVVTFFSILGISACSSTNLMPGRITDQLCGSNV